MLKSCFNTGRYVVLDSGFCVLQAIVGLFKKGLFAGALIKKRKYWPKFIAGDAIDEHFTDKAVGAVDALTGVLNSVRYYVFGMKEPNYTMKIMATGGVIESDDTCKTATRGQGAGRVQFPYTKPFDWHFRYRHAVDDHNNLRHAVPSIEGTWLTQRWEIRVFSFLLAVTEINIYLAMRWFVWSKDEELTLLQFRREFAYALINNPLLPQNYGEDETMDDALDVPCDVVVAPAFAKEYRNRGWVTTATSKYQQYVWRHPNCKKQVRTCCACMKGHWLCTRHIVEHAITKSTGPV